LFLDYIDLKIEGLNNNKLVFKYKIWIQKIFINEKNEKLCQNVDKRKLIGIK